MCAARHASLGLTRLSAALASTPPTVRIPILTHLLQVILPLETPIKSSGHLQILYGNLSPEGAGAFAALDAGAARRAV